ncbi:MAG TPA: serine hydrolase domain-containing protein [Longimicrobiales bacterium]
MRTWQQRILAPFLFGLVTASCGAAAVAPRTTPVPHPVPGARPDPNAGKAVAAGLSPSLFTTLDSIMSRAIADSVTPGGAIAVGRHGRLVVLRGYGSVDFLPGALAVTDSTLYDLASLTKVVAATTAAMILEEDGRLDLDQPVVSYVPEFNAPDKTGVTVRMLLLHRSGLRQSTALHEKYHGLQHYIEQINALPLAWPPGTHTEYTDWNMVVLQAVVERIAIQPLDAFVRDRVFTPLGMDDTRFNPGAPLRARAAPTRARGGLALGVVHDPTGYALGGVSGNAGLFSSARDLAVFAQMLLNGGTYNGVRVLHPATIARWTARQERAASRALGWDTPAEASSAGQFMSPWSFGHTGFTGTSIWADVNADMFIVLLTNYTRPSSNNPCMRALRWAVDDAVRSAVTDMTVRDWQGEEKEPIRH